MEHQNPQTGHHHSGHKHESLIQTLLDCARACEECAAACLEEKDVNALFPAILINRVGTSV